MMSHDAQRRDVLIKTAKQLGFKAEHIQRLTTRRLESEVEDARSRYEFEALHPTTTTKPKPNLEAELQPTDPEKEEEHEYDEDEHDDDHEAEIAKLINEKKKQSDTLRRSTATTVAPPASVSPLARQSKPKRQKETKEEPEVDNSSMNESVLDEIDEWFAPYNKSITAFVQRLTRPLPHTESLSSLPEKERNLILKSVQTTQLSDLNQLLTAMENVVRDRAGVLGAWIGTDRLTGSDRKTLDNTTNILKQYIDRVRLYLQQHD
jgi:hypothetical protein